MRMSVSLVTTRILSTVGLDLFGNVADMAGASTRTDRFFPVGTLICIEWAVEKRRSGGGYRIAYPIIDPIVLAIASIH